MIREFEESDLEAIRSLHERSSAFPFPNLKLCLVKEVVEYKERIIAFGVIKLTSEAIVCIDSKEKRSVELFQTEKVSKFNTDELHAFLTGDTKDSFARILKDRFGFVDITGIPLVNQL